MSIVGGANHNAQTIIRSKSLVINGVNFVSGLHWITNTEIKKCSSERPISIGNTTLTKAGKATLDVLTRFDADTVCWRQSNASTAVQIGLGQKNNIENFVKGSVSLASFVIDHLPELDLGSSDRSTCIVFQEGDVFCLVAQSNGSIIPGGDYFGPLDEIRAEALRIISHGGYDIFAPDEMEIAGSYPSPALSEIADIVNKRKLSAYRLVAAKPNIKIFGIIIVGASVVIASSIFGWNYFEQTKNIELDKIAQEQMRLLLEKQSSAKPVVNNISFYSPENYLNTCLSAYSKERIFPGGWSRTMGVCEREVLTVYYERKGSRVDYLKERYPDAIFSNDGEKAMIKRPLIVEKTDLSVDSLLEQKDAVFRLNLAAQKQEVILDIRVVKAKPSLPGRANKEPSLASKEVPWLLTSKFVGALTLPIKGSGINNIVISGDEGYSKMKINGVAYVR